MKDLIKAYDGLHQAYVELKGVEFDQCNLDELAIDYAYDTCALAGNRFSLEDADRQLRGGKHSATHEPYNLKEHNQLFNARWSFKLIHQMPPGGLTEQELLDLHFHTLSNENPKQAGKYASEKERKLFLQAFSGFNQFLNHEHPMISGARMHYDTAHIRPFDACNQRMGRLLHNYALVSQKHSNIRFALKDRRKYDRALERKEIANFVQRRREEYHDALQQGEAVFTEYCFQCSMENLRLKVKFLKHEKWLSKQDETFHESYVEKRTIDF